MRHNGQMHVDPLVQETTEESRGTWAAAGNLTFGYQNNAILPPPLMTAGDDVSGVATPADVFVDAVGGDLHLQPGGPGVATGRNVYGLPEYGVAASRPLDAVFRGRRTARPRGSASAAGSTAAAGAVFRPQPGSTPARRPRCGTSRSSRCSRCRP